MPPRSLVRTPAGALAVLLILACCGAALAFGALAVGSVDVSLGALLRVLAGDREDAIAGVVLDLRLPRVVAAFATGGLLAMCGALMQVLLRNPLADPYVLGISGGAAVGALLAVAAGWAGGVVPGALVGAWTSTLLVFGLARHGDEGAIWSPTRLLLTGVVIASGWAAVIALLLALAPEAQLKGMLFWLLGDLSAATSGLPALVVLVAVLIASLALARDLNVMVRGGQLAASLGVAVPRLSLLLYGLTALGTSVAVTTAGSIGFVGLVVPHALRLVLGNDQRVLLPACAIAGGALLVVADTIARSAVAPLQLPVGVVTALLGVPMFLVLLTRRPARA